MKKISNPAGITGEPNRDGNHVPHISSNDSRSTSVHGKSFSTKSFDQLAAEQGLTTFSKGK